LVISQLLQHSADIKTPHEKANSMTQLKI